MRAGFTVIKASFFGENVGTGNTCLQFSKHGEMAANPLVLYLYRWVQIICIIVWINVQVKHGFQVKMLMY